MSKKTYDSEKPGTFNQWETASSGDIFTHWKQQVDAPKDKQEGKLETFFLFDIDDTILESLMLWIETMTSYAPALTVQLVLASPTPFKLLESVLGSEVFHGLEDLLRADEKVNTHGSLTHPELPVLIENLLKKHGTLLGGLTARHNQPNTKRQTWQKLESVQMLAGYPVMFRPTDIQYEQSAYMWKPQVLRDLLEGTQHKTCILVDDSVETARGVGKQNLDHPEQPIVQILLRTKINSIGVSEMQQNGLPAGVFVAENWEEVAGQVELAKRWVRGIHSRLVYTR